jgi:hypothetical protein
MEKDRAALMSILEDRELPIRERSKAANDLAFWARKADQSTEVHSEIFELLFEFWQRLCRRSIGDYYFLTARAQVARACMFLTMGLPKDGPTVCWDHPRHDDVEGPRSLREGGLVRGAFEQTSHFGHQCHWGYPVAGVEIRKDLIMVVEPDGTRKPLLDWCSDQKVFVFCGSCGLDVTFEVSRFCPWTRLPMFRRLWPDRGGLR